MKKVEYKNMYQNENSHFFYVVLHKAVLSLLETYAPKNKRKLKILDAGCGTGLLAIKMAAYGQVEGIDFSSEAVKFAQQRGVKAQKASVEKLPFKNNCFDIVTCIDVITSKSIKDDMVPLSEFFRVLKPNGILILRVSANRWLHLNHDEHVHMNHRYEPNELKSKLINSGFFIEKLTYTNAILYPLIVVRHIWEHLFKPKETKSTISKVNPVINNLLIKLLSLETTVMQKVSLPCGLGLLCVARKK